MTDQTNIPAVQDDGNPRAPSLDGNPNVVDVSANEIAKMLGNGYRLQLVRKRDFRATDMKLHFQYPVMPMLSGQRTGNCIYVTVEVHDGVFCDFHCRPTELLDEKAVSDVIDGLYDHVGFEGFKINKLRWFKSAGMADSTSSLKGSVVYLRGQNIHIVGVCHLLSEWCGKYLSLIYDRFSTIVNPGITPQDVVDFCGHLKGGN